MINRIHSNFLIIFFTLSIYQFAYADQESFPFDKQCLKFDKANFKVGEVLLDVMTAGDFPQYCVLYSLSNYQIKQKTDDGYFIVGSNLDKQHIQETTVFLKTDTTYQQNQTLNGKVLGGSKPVGQWVYFVDTETLARAKDSEREYYVFQEIDF